MERIHLKTTIDAPREKVWKTLWSDDTYPQWTSVFAEGGSVKTDWKKGGKIIFLDGNNEGMVSMIAENVPNEIMSFRHLGTYHKGSEDFQQARSEGWSGAIEHYMLRTVNGKTELTIDQDIENESKVMFEKKWPKALQDLKKIAEAETTDKILSELSQHK